LLNLTKVISQTESTEQISPQVNAIEGSLVKEKSKSSKSSEENPSSKRPRVQATLSSLFQKATEKKAKSQMRIFFLMLNSVFSNSFVHLSYVLLKILGGIE
jgi:hypothetical protein